jgi:hypothetical protein
MTSSLPPAALDQGLVLNFFWRFSAFECALKREGFLKAGRNNAAEPDWKRFGHEITGRFASVAVSGLTEAREQLRQLSPRRQVVREGRIGWEPVQQNHESEEEYILRLMRIVRNNLFHGGKYPDGPIDEIARNRDILRAALTILDACCEIHGGLKRWMDQAA